MKASQVIGLVVLSTFTIFFRPAFATRSLKWAIDDTFCDDEGQPSLLESLLYEIDRAFDIARNVVSSLQREDVAKRDNITKREDDDVIIQNFINVLFKYENGLEWVRDVFAGEGLDNLPGIANFDTMVRLDDIDELGNDDLLFHCTATRVYEVEVWEDAYSPMVYVAGGPIGAYALGTMPKCGDEYEEPDEEDPKGSVPMIVITDTQGINQIYICEWMLWNIAIQANEAQIYRTGIFHPDSMNALELRDRMDAWPLGTDWFGENSWSFIDKFVQFDMMLLEALTKTSAGGFKVSDIPYPLNWEYATALAASGDETAVKYNAGSYMFLALAIFLYKTGFDLVPESGDFTGTLPWDKDDFGS